MLPGNIIEKAQAFLFCPGRRVADRNRLGAGAAQRGRRTGPATAVLPNTMGLGEKS